MVEGAAPVRVGEGRSSAWSRKLSRSTTQQMRSTMPARMRCAPAITGRSDCPARCHGREHVGDAGRLAGCECGHETEHLTLMRTQRASGEGHALRFGRRYYRINSTVTPIALATSTCR